MKDVLQMKRLRLAVLGSAALLFCAVVAPLARTRDLYRYTDKFGVIFANEVPEPPAQVRRQRRGDEISASSTIQGPASSSLPSSPLPIGTDLSDLSALSTDSFGGCLMIMDDNHFLVEWLAYNWFVLPLRHLTVMVDPKSRTSPVEIFHRWKKYMKIDIVNWTYPEELGIPIRLFNLTSRNYTAAEPVNKAAIGHYLATQNKFMEDCLKTYKRRNWGSFVMNLDPDEFMAASKITRYESSKQYHVLYNGTGFVVPSNEEMGSVMKVLKHIESQEAESGSGNVLECLKTSRREICLTTNETVPSSFWPNRLGFDDKDFLTHHWTWADRSVKGKQIVNVGSIEGGMYEKRVTRRRISVEWFSFILISTMQYSHFIVDFPVPFFS